MRRESTIIYFPVSSLYFSILESIHYVCTDHSGLYISSYDSSLKQFEIETWGMLRNILLFIVYCPHLLIKKKKQQQLYHVTQ